jgi:D-sedoheptulose 7-phosphate isomerase
MFADGLTVYRSLLEDVDLIAHVVKVAEKVVEVYGNHGKVLAFGNGGSAADAQHFVAELVGRFAKEREPLAAIALTTNTSTLTAVGNDYGFEKIFSRQVEALAVPGDLVIGLSTSGNSQNVVAGLETANVVGATTVGLTGRDGGVMKDVVDHCLCVPSTETPRIQEGHVLLIHAIAALIEEIIFGA